MQKRPLWRKIETQCPLSDSENMKMKEDILLPMQEYVGVIEVMGTRIKLFD